MTAYYAITDAGFDVHKPNEAGQTFLQKLILESSSLSLNKITGIVQAKLPITQEQLDAITSEMDFVRANNSVVKSAMQILSQYSQRLHEYQMS